MTHYKPARPFGLQEFEAPRFLDSQHKKVVRKDTALSSKSGSWVFVGVGHGMYLVSLFRLPEFRRGCNMFGTFLCVVWKFRAFDRFCTCVNILKARGLIYFE
jgi:hypothetical protein